jgi:hypothetical protein
MKLKSMRMVFAKYGKDIHISNPKTRNTINFACPELVRKPKNFLSLPFGQRPKEYQNHQN